MSDFIDRLLNFIGIFLVVLGLGACSGSQGTTSVGNPQNPTVSSIQNGLVTVNMGLALFGGDTGDIARSLVSITVNGSVVEEDQNLSAFFNSESQAVIFEMNRGGILNDSTASTLMKFQTEEESDDLQEGDTVGFLIQNSSGGSSTFSGTVSTTQAATTSRSLSSFSDVNTVNQELCISTSVSSMSSEEAFVCAWIKLLILAESSEVQTLLGKFDESTIDVASVIFGNDGMLVPTSGGLGSTEKVEIPLGEIWPLFNYTQFDGSDSTRNNISLPFALTFSSNSFFQAIDVILNAAVLNGENTQDIQDQLLQLIDDLEDIEELLEVVLADTGFSYVFPASFWLTNDDVTVTYNDARLKMASVQGSLVGLNLLDAYDLGIQVQDFMVSGEVDVDVLAADLNGSGETVNGVRVDTVRFLSLDDASLITNQETRLTQALSRARIGLNNLAQGAVSEFFVVEFDQYYSLQSGVSVIEQLQQALAGMTSMTTFDTSFNLNLDEFFTNPPDGASVSINAGDPAIVNSTTGEVELVESYFQTFLTDIAEF